MSEESILKDPFLGSNHKSNKSRSLGKNNCQNPYHYHIAVVQIFCGIISELGTFIICRVNQFWEWCGPRCQYQQCHWSRRPWGWMWPPRKASASGHAQKDLHRWSEFSFVRVIYYACANLDLYWIRQRFE